MTERILESVEARVPRTTREISASTPCNRIRLRTGIARPNFYWPEFSWAAMVELVLPLTITVLAAQNAQGFVVLEAAGHKPPINAVTVVLAR
jgi:predicted benzoate:H+ symporter BenE